MNYPDATNPSCLPVVLSPWGLTLSDAERTFFTETQPFGFLLMNRNIGHKEQVKQLVQDLRSCIHGHKAPILIDNEGGRVQRLKGNDWIALPSMNVLGLIYEKDPQLGEQLLKLHSLINATQLTEIGIDVVCAPVLDLFFPDKDQVIGDRAFSANPDVVAACGRIVADHLMMHGLCPIIKHLPGHGRVSTDPHKTKTSITTSLDALRQSDFIPFKKLNDLPWAMTSHIIFEDIDPLNPASLSSLMHQKIYREELGYDGLLISDNVGMGALSMPLEQRGHLVLNAGSDLICYYSQTLDEAKRLTQDLPFMSALSFDRWKRADALTQQTPPVLEGVLDSSKQELFYHLKP